MSQEQHKIDQRIKDAEFKQNLASQISNELSIIEEHTVKAKEFNYAELDETLLIQLLTQIKMSRMTIVKLANL